MASCMAPGIAVAVRVVVMCNSPLSSTFREIMGNGAGYVI